jgi:hypothetical protein
VNDGALTLRRLALHKLRCCKVVLLFIKQCLLLPAIVLLCDLRKGDLSQMALLG